MNPPCAKCYKPVYPVEKLSILDKFWHKGCFKCTSCNSSLTLKTFKGFNKQPYCPAHYPKPEHSTIADDPESKRLRQQQQIVSNVEYHKEFQEKIKGHYTPVADDPEWQRIKKNTEIQSQASYRTDPSAFNYTPVTDDPETMRLKKNTEIQSNVKYRGVGVPGTNVESSSSSSPPPPFGLGEQETKMSNAIMNQNGNHNPHVLGRDATYSTSPSSVNQDQRTVADAQMRQQVLIQEQQRRIQIEQQQRQIEEQQRLEGEKKRKEELELQKQLNFERQQAAIMEKQRLERMEQERRRLEEEKRIADAEQEKYRIEMRRRQEAEEQLRLQTEQMRIGMGAGEGNLDLQSTPVYKAEYDYLPDPNDPEAADELAFEEGDIIVDLVKIDDGWSTGTNKRTGLTGMLPSNYIMRIK